MNFDGYFREMLTVSDSHKIEPIEEKILDDSIWSLMLKQNLRDKNLLSKFMKNKITKKEYYIKRKHYDSSAIGMDSYNIRPQNMACKHACIYCYITPMFAKWNIQYKVVDIEDIMPVNKKKVQKKWKKLHPTDKKMMFFPSSCDTFAENANDYVATCRNIIDAGYEIFFVTKPTMKSIIAITDNIEKLPDAYKHKFVIFVTITSDDNEILKIYEPYASSFEERVKVLKYLVKNGYNANVMMEPYLSNPIRVAKKVIPYLNDGIIYIGRMNHTKDIVFNEDKQLDTDIRQYLGNLYSKENMIKLWEFSETQLNVYLNQSIREILES
jgi:DNA repair photolyase